MLIRNKVPTLHLEHEYQQTTSIDLLLVAQRLLVDGEAQFLASILELEHNWRELPGVVSKGYPPCPFQFTPAEKIEIEADAKGASEGINLMRSVKDSIGKDLFPEKGLVRVEQYDEVKDALRQMKDQVFDLYAHNEEERAIWEERWPFDD